MIKLKKSDMWLTILASVGVGAATYFTMSKNNSTLSKVMENAAPILSDMTNQQEEQDQTGKLGQHGMS